MAGRLAWAWVLVGVWAVVWGEAGDLDHIDTDYTPDPEAVLKCDACKIVAHQFAEGFRSAHGDRPLTSALREDEVIEAAEAVCDDAWLGYGTTRVKEEERLAGPGSEFKTPLTQADEDGLWSRRLQDMCDEYLAEAAEERILYNVWASGASMQDFLCRGDGTFSACTSDEWGSWPGEDYEDYEDDFEYLHDEF